jgi:signal peptidase I
MNNDFCNNFKIPSGSMMPTLIPGDFIAVNKFAYGLRLPVFNKLLVPWGLPERGDVFVFHYPKDPSVDYIKRVIGLPGDHIRYDGKKLYINNELMQQEVKAEYVYEYQEAMMVTAIEKIEQLDTVEHSILLHDIPAKTQEFNVPPGFYLAMGDNRDNSSDSRVWGFVPENLLVGKAFVIWMNFSEMNRIGNWIK